MTHEEILNSILSHACPSEFEDNNRIERFVLHLHCPDHPGLCKAHSGVKVTLRAEYIPTLNGTQYKIHGIKIEKGVDGHSGRG